VTADAAQATSLWEFIYVYTNYIELHKMYNVAFSTLYSAIVLSRGWKEITGLVFLLVHIFGSWIPIVQYTFYIRDVRSQDIKV